MSWDLAPSIESASRSRRESRAACVAWGIDDATTAAVVDVVNELVSNALAHGAPPIVLRLEAAIDEVTVMVSDAADEPPRMLAYRPGITDRGLGLHLVTQLSEKWGATPGAAGKTVWATVGRAKPRGSVVREGR
jgi:two-component sensor histidine kinase